MNAFGDSSAAVFLNGNCGGPVKMFSQVDEFLWLEKEAFVIKKRKENLAGSWMGPRRNFNKQ